jgi:hypothetical protein
MFNLRLISFVVITMLVATLSTNVNAIQYDIIKNPAADIKSSTGYFRTIPNFVLAFENARSKDPTVKTDKKKIVIPQNFLNLTKINQIQWILDSEREARGLIVNYPNTQRLNTISQSYAKLISDTGQFSHYINGTTPWTRMDSDNVLKSCKESSYLYGESIFKGWSSSTSTIMWHLYSIYGFIYDDAGSNWGHRMHLLANFNNNHRLPDTKEGLLGIGLVETIKPGNIKESVVVINSIDPNPTCPL